MSKKAESKRISLMEENTVVTCDGVAEFSDQFLADILNGNVEFLKLVEAEMMRRGLDRNGKLVGVTTATKIFEKEKGSSTNIKKK